MPDQASRPADSSVAEIKRELASLLIENGMDPKLVSIISKMQPYKIQLFDRIYQGYGHRPDYIKERAKELLHRDMKKPHIKEEIDKAAQNWDEDRFLEFAFTFYRKALALEFIKTEMHEYMNSLQSSQDRTSFMVAEKTDRIRVV